MSNLIVSRGCLLVLLAAGACSTKASRLAASPDALPSGGEVSGSTGDDGSGGTGGEDALPDPGTEIRDAAEAEAISSGGAPATGGQPASGGTQANDGGISSGGTSDCRPLHGQVTSVTEGSYCVDGDVIIPENSVLDIPAGTTFIFKGRYHFGRDPSFPDDEAHPSGGLRAIGTADKPIVFRGETSQTQWFGIVIYHSSAVVQLEYVTIQDANKDDTDPNSRIWRRGGGLNSYVNNRGTIIRHCKFSNNRARSIAGALAINSHGVWPNEGPVEITDSTFDNNSCDCATYAESTADRCGGGAIRFSHIGGDAKVVTIQNNTFRANRASRTTTFDAYGGAIGGFDDGIIIGPGNVFQDNQATHDGAITCAGQSQLGPIIKAVDSSVTFTGNTPNNGCGL